MNHPCRFLVLLLIKTIVRLPSRLRYHIRVPPLGSELSRPYDALLSEAHVETKLRPNGGGVTLYYFVCKRYLLRRVINVQLPLPSRPPPNPLDGDYCCRMGFEVRSLIGPGCVPIVFRSIY